MLTLIGMPGSGKSAVGAELARMLGTGFADSDAEIVKAAGMSITEIFARDGEAFFREREGEVLARLLSGEPKVLAVGGGAWIQPANRALIREAGVAVWLDVPLETLWARVAHRTHRPLLATDDPRATLEATLAARRPVYAEADVCVEVSPTASVETTARTVMRAIAAARPEVLA